jgi:hypothetical protein
MAKVDDGRPTKASLLRAVKQLTSMDELPDVAKLRQAYNVANKAVEQFEKTNKEYLKLKKIADDASHAYYGERGSGSKRREEFTSLRSYLLAKIEAFGCDAETMAEVQAFVKRFKK